MGMTLLRWIRDIQKSRYFNLEGFKLIDLINPYYIDRKTIYDFIVTANRKYVRGGVILDFGCGSKPYEHLFQSEKYIGCDIFESGHGKDDKKADVFYDGHTLPFESGHFDVILTTQVLEHVQYFDQVFKELVRVLKKNGIFIATVPLAGEEHEKPYDFRRFTTFGINNLFDEYGIELLEIKKSTNYKNCIRFIQCMYSDNKYRKNKNFKNFVCRYLRCISENLKFVLQDAKTDAEDDLGINLFVVGKKI